MDKQARLTSYTALAVAIATAVYLIVSDFRNKTQPIRFTSSVVWNGVLVPVINDWQVLEKTEKKLVIASDKGRIEFTDSTRIDATRENLTVEIADLKRSAPTYQFYTVRGSKLVYAHETTLTSSYVLGVFATESVFLRVKLVMEVSKASQRASVEGFMTLDGIQEYSLQDNRALMESMLNARLYSQFQGFVPKSAP